MHQEWLQSDLEHMINATPSESEAQDVSDDIERITNRELTRIQVEFHDKRILISELADKELSAVRKWHGDTKKLKKNIIDDTNDAIAYAEDHASEDIEKAQHRSEDTANAFLAYFRKKTARSFQKPVETFEEEFLAHDAHIVYPDA